ncbi:MAG: prepilin-type N-terminal cleavage/methylation domain-containing protein [Rhodospirillales bacterium]
MAARSSEAGFTLLELLAALTVLAVLMAMMFGGLRFGARVWESGDEGLRGLSELQTAAGFIRRQIA